jgi:hypothetical protein
MCPAAPYLRRVTATVHLDAYETPTGNGNAVGAMHASAPYLQGEHSQTVFVRKQIGCCMVQEPLYVREVTQAIPEHLSISEAMRLTTLSRSTIDRLCAEGRLEKRRVSAGRAVITVESLERHLAELNGAANSTPAVPEERVSRRQQALRAQSAARREARQRRRRAA